MKLLSAILTLSLLHQTPGQLACPDPLAHEYPINDELTMHFDLVLNEDNVTDGSIICARIESASTGWIGFGINPKIGQMVGAEAIIGIPANNTVKKYFLFSKELDGVVEMDGEAQTLMDTSITQDAEGRTTMSFTKYLFEDKYGIIPSDFVNSFIWAVGSSNELGYHASRGNFGIDLLTTLSPVSAPPTSAAQASLAPSVAATTTEGGDAASTSISPTLAVTDSAGSSLPTLIGTKAQTTPSPSVVSAEGNETTDSPVAEFESSGAPVGVETTTFPSSAYVEVGSTSSPVAGGEITGSPISIEMTSFPSSATVGVAVSTGSPVATVETTPSPVESGSDATLAPSANATVEEFSEDHGLDFADGDEKADAVASAESDMSGAVSLKVGGLLFTAGIVLSCVVEF